MKQFLKGCKAMEKTKNELILEAAFEVFSNKGFHGARMEEIAEKAGVGKGTIYEYFKNKVHLFHEMLIMQIENYFGELEKGLDLQATAEEKMHNLIKRHVTFSQGLQSIVNKFMIESSSGMDADVDIKQRMMDTYNKKFQNIKSIIATGVKNGEFREDLDIDTLTVFFFGGLTGITNTMLMLNLDLDPDEIAEKVMDFLTKGIEMVHYSAY